MSRRVQHRYNPTFLLIAVAALACGCATVTPAVGPCQGLQVQDLGNRVQAVCWSDDSSVLEAVNRPDFLGPDAIGVLELLEQFAHDRDQLPIRGSADPRIVAGFHYSLSHPAIVQGRAQYNLEVTLPEPFPATSIVGPANDVIIFVREAHPNAGIVNLDFVPMFSEFIGTVTLHFDQWNLRRLTIEEYRSNR